MSVIIPVYKGGQAFLRCLRSVLHAAPPADEVIVVSDGGMEGTPFPEDRSNITLLETPTRGGPAKARNVGAQAAKGEFLFFIDADVLIQPNAIGIVKQFFRDRPDVAALFGSYDDSPSEANFLSQYRNLLHHYVHQNGQEEASTFWGACGAIRREVFLELGGFDETRYRQPAIEDIELGYRIKKAGYRIHLCKSLQITHLKHWGPLSLLKTDFSNAPFPGQNYCYNILNL